MRISTLAASCLLVSVCFGCSSSATEPTVDPPIYPKIAQTYDTMKGGVQIVEIAPDQTKNGIATSDTDEWVVLQSDRARRISGWMLYAGDPSQTYELPDSIIGKLTIYTHSAPHPTSKLEFSLGLAAGKWIWNNSVADTARIFDSTGQLVSTLSY